MSTSTVLKMVAECSSETLVSKSPNSVTTKKTNIDENLKSHCPLLIKGFHSATRAFLSLLFQLLYSRSIKSIVTNESYNNGMANGRREREN
jgi:hypothetical protein